MAHTDTIFCIIIVLLSLVVSIIFIYLISTEEQTLGNRPNMKERKFLAKCNLDQTDKVLPNYK